VLSLVFDVAHRSYLPSLIGREHLVEGNSKLALSRSGVEVAGPGAAGLIIQIASAPTALIADAVTFVISALCLHSIHARETQPEHPESRPSLFKDAKDGLAAVWASPILRALALTATTLGFSNAAFEAVYLLYTARDLEVNAGLIGLISATAGGGFILGAIVAGRLIRRIGIGAAIVTGALLTALSDLALPLVGGALPVIVAVLIAGQFSFGIGVTVFNIGQVSLRQSVTPNRLQGRMNAVFHVAMVGSVPLGALLGGLLGETIGLRPTLFIAVAGEISAVAWLLASPVRRLRDSPQPAL
jgi:predicted MFS family arabinose efflux permease